MKKLMINETEVFCYEDGSIEWKCTRSNQSHKKGDMIRTLGSNRGKGYLGVVINGHSYKVHRLIASAFLSNPNGLPQVDHINRCKTDNRPENLRWVDNYTNQLNTTRHEKAVEEYGVGGFNSKEYNGRTFQVYAIKPDGKSTTYRGLSKTEQEEYLKLSPVERYFLHESKRAKQGV